MFVAPAKQSSWPAFAFVALTAIIGVILNHYSSDQTTVYRVASFCIMAWQMLAAYAIWPSISRTAYGLGVTLFLLRVTTAGVFFYVWVFASLGRPDWFRQDFFWVFVMMCCALGAATGLHTYTVAHTRQRSLRFVAYAVAILAASIALNGFLMVPAKPVAEPDFIKTTRQWFGAEAQPLTGD